MLPNTTYILLIKYGDKEEPLIKKYKTLPDQFKDEDELTFISGGDVGNYETSDKIA